MLDEALVLETGQRGAHGRPSDAQLSGHVCLDQPLGGLKAPGDDRLAQPILGSGTVDRGIVDNFVDHLGAQLTVRELAMRGVLRRV